MAYGWAAGLSLHISTTDSGLAWVFWSQTASIDRNLDTYFFLDPTRLNVICVSSAA